VRVLFAGVYKKYPHQAGKSMTKPMRSALAACVFMGLGSAGVHAQPVPGTFGDSALNIGGAIILLPLGGGSTPNPQAGLVVDSLQALLPTDPGVNSSELSATVSDNVLTPPETPPGTPAPVFSDSNSAGAGTWTGFSGIGNFSQNAGLTNSAQQAVRVQSFGNR